jgi:hypothetical protein
LVVVKVEGEGIPAKAAEERQQSSPPRGAIEQAIQGT